MMANQKNNGGEIFASKLGYRGGGWKRTGIRRLELDVRLVASKPMLQYDMTVAEISVCESAESAAKSSPVTAELECPLLPKVGRNLTLRCWDFGHTTKSSPLLDGRLHSGGKAYCKLLCP